MASRDKKRAVCAIEHFKLLTVVREGKDTLRAQRESLRFKIAENRLLRAMVRRKLAEMQLVQSAHTLKRAVKRRPSPR